MAAGSKLLNMKYSLPIDFAVPLEEMRATYWKEFGCKLGNTTDSRIVSTGQAWLISAGDTYWPVQDLMDAYGLRLETARIFVTEPHKNLPIHRDCLGGKQTLREWAINIPIENCDRGVNEWFADEVNDFTSAQFIPTASAMVADELQDYVVSESCGLDEIRLIRTDVMHRSNNQANPNRRVVLSIRGDAALSYDMVASKIKSSFSSN